VPEKQRARRGLGGDWAFSKLYGAKSSGCDKPAQKTNARYDIGGKAALKRNQLNAHLGTAQISLASGSFPARPNETEKPARDPYFGKVQREI